MVSGTPDFRETRAMAEILFGYFLSGYDLEDFLVDHAGVTRERIAKLLLLAGDTVEVLACESRHEQ